MNLKITLVVLFSMAVPLGIFAQGYYNNENFGNRSLLLGGNVTGSVDDLGLTYYNPARIALVDNPVFSINAKAYQINAIDFKNVFGEDSQLSDSKFEGVPSLVAGTFKIDKWEKHHFAYAFISRQRSSIGVNLSNELDEDENDGDELDRVVGNLELKRSLRDEWFGLTWGMKLRDNFSIGISSFISAFSFKSYYDVGLSGLYASDEVTIFNNEANISQNSYGMFWKLGLAWKLDKIDIGLNIDFPYLELVNSGKFRYQRFLSGTDDGSDEFYFYDFEDLEARRKEPLGISFGAGIPWGKSRIHVKADWHGAVSEYDRLVIPETDDGRGGFGFSETLRSVINFGAGAEIFINDGLNLYASFTTDFSPVESSANLFDIIQGQEGDDNANFDADYFHYGFGMEFKLKKVELTIGATYSSASGEFSEPIELPIDDGQPSNNDNPSTIEVSRWRFIVGLEIPIFGYDLEFK